MSFFGPGGDGPRFERAVSIPTTNDGDCRVRLPDGWEASIGPDQGSGFQYSVRSRGDIASSGGTATNPVDRAGAEALVEDMVARAQIPWNPEE